MRGRTKIDLLRALEVFLAAADSGSMTTAAHNLKVTQSAISQQLKLLEAEMGVTLMDRNTRPLRLTTAGQALRAHAAELRAMIAEWENDRERSARYERELLPLASERTQATVGAYRGAKASITDVLLARRNEIDLRMQALQLEMDTARLWAQLNFLVPEGDAATHAHLRQTKDSQ